MFKQPTLFNAFVLPWRGVEIFTRKREIWGGIQGKLVFVRCHPKGSEHSDQQSMLFVLKDPETSWENTHTHTHTHTQTT